MKCGHAARVDWPLNPNVLYLNHGTVGVAPRRVLRAVPLAAGDEILVTDLAYGAVGIAAAQRAREADATVRTRPGAIALDLPALGADWCGANLQWMRVSAQVYVGEADLERLADAVLARLAVC